MWSSGVRANFVESVLSAKLYMGFGDNTQVVSLTWQVSSPSEPPRWPPAAFKLTLPVSCQEEEKISGFHVSTNSSTLDSVSPLLL